MYLSTDIWGQFTNLLHSKHYKSLYMYMDRNDKYPSCIFITYVIELAKDLFNLLIARYCLLEL